MPTEEPLLAPAGGGFTIRYRNRCLHSPLDPRGAVLRRLERALPGGTVPAGTLLYLPSPGVGYGLQELLELLPSEGRVLGVETDPRLFSLIGARGAVPLPRDPRLVVLRASDPGQALAALHELGVWRFRRVRTLVLSGGYALNGAAYDSIREALEDEIQLFWQNKMTLIRMSRLWLSNLFENLLQLPQAQPLSGLRTRRPVVVAGAGPSLERSLERLREARVQDPGDDGRPLLAAVDTALPVLREKGLRPDLVFLLEAQAVNLQDFIGWQAWRTPAVCDLTAHPTLVRRFGPAARFFSSRFAPVRLLERLESGGLLPHPIPPLGSVGVAAAGLALELTSGPVLLAGLDFSYPGGRTHARGSPADRLALSGSDRLRPVGQGSLEGLLLRPLQARRDAAGRPVLTDLVLLSYARQLSARIRPESRVYALGDEGLPLGARLLRSAGELREVCASPAAAPNPAAPALPGPDLPRVLGFLEEETARLAELRAALRGSGRPDAARTAALLSELDYLTLHFPEADPRPAADPGTLARVLLAADYFHGRLERLLERAGRP